ncbi:MAG: hypothetical protein ACSHWY_12340 [Octadecabacter sp.]
MLHITSHAYADALNRSGQTGYRRLVNKLFAKGRNGLHWYSLATALPTTRRSEWPLVPNLIAAASDIDAAPPPTPIAATAVESWLDNLPDSGPSQRAAEIRSHFVNTLAHSVKSSELLRHVEYLRKVVILDDAILKYVILGNESDLPPEFDLWAFDYALINSPKIGELT